MALFRSDSRDVDFVPGTVRLFEFDQHDGTLAVPELVLVPTPSAHPDDPLNWTAARKHLSLACVCLYTLALGLETSALYSIYVPYSEATGISIATLNSGKSFPSRNRHRIVRFTLQRSCVHYSGRCHVPDGWIRAHLD